MDTLRKNKKCEEGLQSPSLYFAVLIFVCVSLGFRLPCMMAQEQILLSDPLEGEVVFKAKGCQSCHAIRGQGGDVAKDLGWHEYYGNAMDLAADLWNHSPVMREVMEELKIERPVFTETEMTQLMAYLYYQRYVKKTGNVLNGKRLLSEKGCLSCHMVRHEGRTLAPRLDRLSDYVSPLFMALAMWNHGPEMEKKMEELDIKWPKFTDEEIVDLTNYLRILRKDSAPEDDYEQPGNPKIGEKLLESKGCIRCHSVAGRGGDIGPDFTQLELDKSVTEIAGVMWNHGATMMALMKKTNVEWPQFKGREIADLVSYLYFIDFAGKPGDPEVGAEVFKAKGCIICHHQNAGTEPTGPDLSQLQALHSPIQLAEIMWNHAPNMESKMRDLGMEWPQFKKGEMENLFEFLRLANTSANF